MLRLTAVCATLALLLTACAGDTSDSANGMGRNGAGGTMTAGLTGPRGLSGRGAPGSQEDLAQTAGDRIFFDTDQSVITPQARETLDRQVQWLQHLGRGQQR